MTGHPVGRDGDGDEEVRGMTVEAPAHATHQLEPPVDPDRFLGADSAWPGHWSSSPVRFDELPEERLLASETRDRIRAALDALPPAQRAVVTMRDLAGCDADEVCETLGLSASNQRVLLHRGRAKLRAALEAHLSQP